MASYDVASNICMALVSGNFNNIIYDWAAPEAVPLHAAGGQGLTLVHFSPQLEPFLTQNGP
jgi:hypothetical protein